MARNKNLDPYLGGKITIGDKPSVDRSDKMVAAYDSALGRRNEKGEVEATMWQNRRPICPYGCGQEGVLVEIVVVPGRGAVGYYKDSEQLVFTAPMKMQPKPSSKKLVIGPDGEPHMVEEEQAI